LRISYGGQERYLPRGAGKQLETQLMPLDERLRAQIETSLSDLDGLIRRGHEVHDLVAGDPSDGPAIAATRAWQEDCGVTVNQLSGGSKAHWLARSFSEALLVRSAAGHAVEGVAMAKIVKRLLDVLEQAVASLSGMDRDKGPGSREYSSPTPETPAPRRFEFVHNAVLRPVLEEAYNDSRRALEQADYDLSLRISCGILEAIVTDALEHKGLGALIAADAPETKLAGKIGDWSFNLRLAVAERAGLIRGGCARLPGIARTYRDHTDADSHGAAVSERDARQVGQVLRVVMRDLDPGR
jgi:hypothetical protein